MKAREVEPLRGCFATFVANATRSSREGAGARVRDALGYARQALRISGLVHCIPYCSRQDYRPHTPPADAVTASSDAACAVGSALPSRAEPSRVVGGLRADDGCVPLSPHERRFVLLEAVEVLRKRRLPCSCEGLRLVERLEVRPREF